MAHPDLDAFTNEIALARELGDTPTGDPLAQEMATTLRRIAHLAGPVIKAARHDRHTADTHELGVKAAHEWARHFYGDDTIADEILTAYETPGDAFAAINEERATATTNLPQLDPATGEPVTDQGRE